MSTLPKPTFLPLKKAVRHVVQACQASLQEARGAIRDAGVSGQLEGFGLCPLNAHPDEAEARRLANGRFKKQKFGNDDWASLNFKTQTSGRLSSIEVNRTDLISLFPAKADSQDATPASRTVGRHPTKSDYSQLIESGAEYYRTHQQAPSDPEYIKFWKARGIAREFVRDALNPKREAVWKDRSFPPHLKRRRGEKDDPGLKSADVK